MLEDTSNHELIRAMVNSRFLFNQALSNGAAGELYRGERVSWSYTGYAVSNYVFDMHFEDGDAASVHRQIDAVLDAFRRRNAQTTWIIDPLCTPGNLASCLDQYPSTSTGTFTAMALNIDDFIPVEPPDAFLIEEATSREELEVWSQVLCDGFGIAEPEATTYRQIFINGALARGPDFTFRHFVGFRQGRPVSATSLLLDGSTAGIYWVATIPAARRQHTASAILSHIIALVRAQGYKWSILQATRMGIELYTYMGFRTYYLEKYYHIAPVL